MPTLRLATYNTNTQEKCEKRLGIGVFDFFFPDRKGPTMHLFGNTQRTSRTITQLLIVTENIFTKIWNSFEL